MGRFTSLLSQNGFLILNKNIVRNKGFEFASVLAVFCRLQEEFEGTELYKQNNGFFQTLEDLQREAIVSKPTLLNTINDLKELGVLIAFKKGVPCRNYYQINDCKLGEFIQLLENGKLVGKPIDQLEGKPISQLEGKPIDQHINNIPNIETNSKDINIVGTKSPKCPPEIKEIVDYLNQTCKRDFKYSETTMKHIRARLNEGFSVEDCKTVIRKKYQEWNGTSQAVYLRPETLFSKEHFESYLNQPDITYNYKQNKKIVPISSAINNVVESEEDEETGNILKGVFDEL